MKGNPKAIEYLNKGLRHELTAVNQFWLHYRFFDNWGYNDFAKKWRKESIEEMEHADRFIDHILFLEGFPNLQELNALRIGENVEEIIRNDLAAEYDARNLYEEAAAYCVSVGDRVSKDLFEELMRDEEGHIDLLETQLELIKQLGVQLYAQKHVGAPEKGEG
jgi:bacterioferritin